MRRHILIIIIVTITYLFNSLDMSNRPVTNQFV